MVKGKILWIIAITCIILSGCSFANVENPIDRSMSKKLFSNYEKQVLNPTNGAYNEFHKDFGAFCKVNKNRDLQNKKRVELARLYLNKVKNISAELPKDNSAKNQAALDKAVVIKQSVEAYLNANSQILDANPQIRRNSWANIDKAYRTLFDSKFEYENLKEYAILGVGTYEMKERNLHWLKPGHNYYHFAGAVKMPGKLISVDQVFIENKNVKREVYLWSVGRAQMVVTFHNGRAIDIKKVGLW